MADDFVVVGLGDTEKDAVQDHMTKIWMLSSSVVWRRI